MGSWHTLQQRPFGQLLLVRISVPLEKRADDRFANVRQFGEALADAVGPMGGPMRLSEVSEYLKQRFRSSVCFENPSGLSGLNR